LERQDERFLNIACKSGVFLREIRDRLFEGLKEEIPDENARLQHIYEKQIFGLAISVRTALISRKSLYETADASHKLSYFDKAVKEGNKYGNIVFEEMFEGERALHKNFENKNDLYSWMSKDMDLTKIFSEDNKMALRDTGIDIVIGNPPYQKSDGGGTGDSAIPIYNNFIEQAKGINPKFLVMIIPSRWMKGGKGLDKFREEMINDKNIRFLYDFEVSTELFPQNHIDGGVCYFLRDRDNKGKCKYIYQPKNDEKQETERYLKIDKLDTVIRDLRQQSIIEKVIKNPPFFSSIVSTQKPYGFRAYTFNRPQSYGMSEIPQTPFKNSAKIYGVKGKKGGAKRVFGYVDRKNITNKNIDKYKLFFSKAYMTTSTVPPKIIEAQPNEICTETFLEIGGFDNKQQASNCLSYIRTKFFRALLFYKRHSLNISQSSFDFIPMQDFNKKWTDEELYKKYDLSPQQINFIEKNILPMTDKEEIQDEYSDEE